MSNLKTAKKPLSQRDAGRLISLLCADHVPQSVLLKSQEESTILMKYIQKAHILQEQDPKNESNMGKIPKKTATQKQDTTSKNKPQKDSKNLIIWK